MVGDRQTGYKNGSMNLIISDSTESDQRLEGLIKLQGATATELMAMMEKGTEHTSNDEKELLAILGELDLVSSIKEGTKTN